MIIKKLTMLSAIAVVCLSCLSNALGSQIPQSVSCEPLNLEIPSGSAVPLVEVNEYGMNHFYVTYPVSFSDYDPNYEENPSWVYLKAWDQPLNDAGFAANYRFDGSNETHGDRGNGEYIVVAVGSDGMVSVNYWRPVCTVTLDTDSDGTPDATDEDDDNDTFSDIAENVAGSDPLSAGSTPAPQNVNQCKNGGFAALTNGTGGPRFRNQGECVSFAVSH